jgi:uncharacterized membrane protein YfcA
MTYLVICLAAFVISGLTLFSGFGLGTVLMPVFALFFPVPVAVAATAVVHLANNLFKLVLVGRHADRRVLIRFAVPAAVAALAGAGLLTLVADLPAWATWRLAGSEHRITPVKAVIGTVIVGFAIVELSPAFARLALPPRHLLFGGLLSGFFGGLSGNQGAFRSAFLIKAGLAREAFVGTGVAAAVVVDVVRLAVYGLAFVTSPMAILAGPVAGVAAAAVLAAFAGAWLGARLLTKVTLRSIHLVVALFLILVGSGLAAGLL